MHGNEMKEPAEEIVDRESMFSARDGFPLSGRLILPRNPRAAVLISSATGMPKEFYLHFARFGAERGAACFIYDYRGVASSAPRDMHSFKMDYPDWGRLDMPAALDRLIKAAPGLPVVHLANSVGGHFMGFMPNHAKITRHIFISVGLGTWWTHRFPKQQFLDLFFWWIYGPLQLALKGYIPAGGLWGGSTLPAGAFRTWRRWSHIGNYFRGELECRLNPHFFNEIKGQIISYVFSDDPMTTPESARTFLEFLPNARKELRVVHPSDLGVRALGHQKLFRRSNALAWPAIWEAALFGL
jgi:predicted alpha/beta hydrolase